MPATDEFLKTEFQGPLFEGEYDLKCQQGFLGYQKQPDGPKAHYEKLNNTGSLLHQAGLQVVRM